MKTEPTDLDREAARLFHPKSGVRVLCSFPRDDARWFRVAGWVGAEDEHPIANIVDAGGKVVATVMHTRAVRLVDETRRWKPRRRAAVKGSTSVESGGMLPDVFAIDTDDPATVGVMLAQVDAMAGGHVDTWARGTVHGVDSRDEESLGCGPTRGAALVAAMRALRGTSS